MARFLTKRRLAALAAAALCSAAPAGAQPSFVTAPVTPDMVLPAMDLCIGQLRAGAFDEGALTGAGWVVAARSDGDMVIRAYRHPDNMILLGTFATQRGPDKCTVMAPTGRGTSLDGMRSALERRMSVRPAGAGGATVWTLDDLRLELRAMGEAGIVIEIQPRSGR